MSTTVFLTILLQKVSWLSVNKSEFRTSWRLVLLTTFLTIITGVSAVFPFMAKHQYIATTIGELTFFIPIILGVRLLKDKQETRNALSTGFFPFLILPLFLMPIYLQIYVTAFTLPLQSLLEYIFGEPDNTELMASGAAEYIIQIFAVCLIPAIVEEFLCRGVLMRLLKTYGTATAILISALAFAVMHYDIHSFLSIFMLGILFSAIRLLTGSIWASVFAHFSNNFWAITLPLIKLPDFFDIVLVITAIVMFPLLFIFFLGNAKYTVTNDTFSKRKPEFSIEMLICLIIFFIFQI